MQWLYCKTTLNLLFTADFRHCDKKIFIQLLLYTGQKKSPQLIQLRAGIIKIEKLTARIRAPGKYRQSF